MRLNGLILLISMCSPGILIAQDHAPHDSHHEHHRHEIGIAHSGVYFVDEKEYSYGLHLHYTGQINHSKWGLGAGYERIFDDHGHNSLGVIVSYRPVDRVNLGLSPGVSFEDEAGDDLHFSMHFESSYEFEFYNFHTGPVIEFAYDSDDFHISLGIHIGYGF